MGSARAKAQKTDNSVAQFYAAIWSLFTLRLTPLAKAIRYALNRMPKTRPYLDNGFLELDNNTAERAMKPVAIGRKNWMFAGSQRGGNSMAIAFTLIETAKLNKVDPQAWLTWVLERIADLHHHIECCGAFPDCGHSFDSAAFAGPTVAKVVQLRRNDL